MSDWRAQVAQQDSYEIEGAQAGLAGKKREDCPYDIAVNPDGWNFWVYGCENAAGEVAIINSGFVEFYNEVSPEPMYKIPVAEAIASGRWRPKWARLPADRGTTASG